VRRGGLSMRTVFLVYLFVIVLGLVLAFVVGALGR
jgi:hypothetical protein